MVVVVVRTVQQYSNTVWIQRSVLMREVAVVMAVVVAAAAAVGWPQGNAAGRGGCLQVECQAIGCVVPDLVGAVGKATSGSACVVH